MDHPKAQSLYGRLDFQGIRSISGRMCKAALSQVIHSLVLGSALETSIHQMFTTKMLEKVGFYGTRP